MRKKCRIDHIFFHQRFYPISMVYWHVSNMRQIQNSIMHTTNADLSRNFFSHCAFPRKIVAVWRIVNLRFFMQPYTYTYIYNVYMEKTRNGRAENEFAYTKKRISLISGKKISPQQKMRNAKIQRIFFLGITITSFYFL